MATPSSILAWEIPWTEEPDRLWGLERATHDLVTKHQTPITPHYSSVHTLGV